MKCLHCNVWISHADIGLVHENLKGILNVREKKLMFLCNVKELVEAQTEKLGVFSRSSFKNSYPEATKKGREIAFQALLVHKCDVPVS